MFHDTAGFLVFALPLLLFAVVLFLLPNRLMGNAKMGMDKNLESIQQRSSTWHQETVEFQQQSLTELRRHNALMEQQSQLLTRLLDRAEQ